MAEMIMSNSSAACGFCLLSFSFARVVVRALDVGNYIGGTAIFQRGGAPGLYSNECHTANVVLIRISTFEE